MSSPTTPAPRAAATAASPTPGSGAGRGASASGSDDADPGRCETRDLMVSVGGGSGGAAGSVDTAVVLTNTGTARCTLYGYPGVSYVAGPDGSQVGAAATLDPTTKPARITLAPGGVAHATLRVVDVRAYPDAACRPAAVDGYRVYPPGTRSAAFVAQAATTCSAAAAQVLSVQPVEPGPPPA